MAPFREAEKKRKDKRRLSKKAHLREWRKETFGNAEGPEIAVGANGANGKETSNDGDIIKAKKMKKRSKTKKAGS